MTSPRRQPESLSMMHALEEGVPSCSTTPVTATAAAASQPVSPTASVKSRRGIIGSASKKNSQARHDSIIEEDPKMVKTGQVIGYLAFTKEKKRQYYACLSDRCFEVHDDYKSYQRKKAARHIFDLGRCFNAQLHEDGKLRMCVSIMTPDETFIFRAASDDKHSSRPKETLEWERLVRNVIMKARALVLGRPVTSYELFLNCWDVVLVGRPKLRKPISKPENYDNICSRKPELTGRRYRLGFYEHLIVLCRMGTQPAFNGAPKSFQPPFKPETFIEINRQFIANWGYQERYFIMRIGRAAATGMCEIYCQCESEEVASSIHNRLNDMIEIESSKKRQSSPVCEYSSTESMEVSDTLPPVPSSDYLECNRVPAQFMVAAALGGGESKSSSNEASVSSRPVMSFTARAPISARSIDQAVLSDITYHEQKSHPHPRANTISGGTGFLSKLKFGSFRFSSSGSGDNTTTVPAAGSRSAGSSNSALRANSPDYPLRQVVDWAKQRISVTSMPDDETEDSGGTLRVVDYADVDNKSTKSAILINGVPPHENVIAELLNTGGVVLPPSPTSLSRRSVSSVSDSEPQKPRSRPRQLTIGSDSGKGDDLDHEVSSRSTPDDSLSYADSSVSDLHEADKHFAYYKSTSDSHDLMPPHICVPSTTEQQKAEDLRNYISDSSDSCYSSINPATGLRAYSFSTATRPVPRMGDNYEVMLHATEPAPGPSETSLRDSESGDLAQPTTAAETSTTPAKTTPEPIFPASSAYLNPLRDDLRKRAFSLGAKFPRIWNPIKMLSHATKSSRSTGSKASNVSDFDCGESWTSHKSQPETQTSMGSVASSIQPRSDSIGSAASSSYKPAAKKQAAPVTVEPHPESVEAAMRSRTSSILSQKHHPGSSKSSVSGDIHPYRKSMEQDEPPTIAESCELQMHEVQCYIRKEDAQILNALMKDRGDTTSLHSSRGGVAHAPAPAPAATSTAIVPEDDASSRSNSRLARHSAEPVTSKPEQPPTLKPTQSIPGGPELSYIEIMVNSRP